PTPSGPRTSATCHAGSRRRAPSSRGRTVPQPPRNAFQYAIVRVLPRVERGECLNVGVVLLCRPERFLGARIALDEARRRASAPDLHPPPSRPHLDAIERVAAGDPAAGPIARLGQA